MVSWVRWRRWGRLEDYLNLRIPILVGGCDFLAISRSLNLLGMFVFFWLLKALCSLIWLGCFGNKVKWWQRWDWVDKNLAKNEFDAGLEGGAEDKDAAEWMDTDAGWRSEPISISVPFNSRAKKRGLQSFYVGDFYHRLLISVIRKKLSNPHDIRHFHYEPYELLWKPTGTKPDTWVYGELYTSPAFLEAHCKLQDSPKVPGCNLQRVVVALMFWSDGTQLTSFGDVNIWPCYMYYGNESKYRRSKPSSHLCNHVGYFQAVSSL